MKALQEPCVEEEFARWAQPLILDRLTEVYHHANPGNRLRAAALVAMHARVWRAMLSGELTKGRAMRQELMREVGRAQLALDHVVRADKAVLEELYIVVRQRFRASRHLSVAHLRPLEGAMRDIQGMKLAA